MTSQGWRPGLVAAAATLFLSVVFFLGPLTDDDLSLHIGMGRRLAAGGLPSLFGRSFTATPGWHSLYQDWHWYPHEWLFSVMVWSVNRLAGPFGLWVVRWAGWGLWLALLVHAGSPPSRGAFYYLALVIGLLSGTPLWTLRPHLVMLLGIVLTVLVARRPEPGKWFVGLAAFYLLWANTHASAFIGLGAWLLWRLPLLRLRPWRELGSLVVLAATTFVNPAGWRLWLWPLQFLGESKGSFVAEWGPLWSAPLWPHVALFLVFTTFVGFALARIRRERPFPWRELVLWGGFTLFALVSRRMVAPAVVSGLLALGSCVARDRFWRRTDGKHTPDLRIALVLGILLLGSWWHPAGKRPFPDPALWPSLQRVTADTFNVVGLFHPYEWGGLLMLKGYPTFIDGRTEAFTPKHLANYGTLYYCGPGWEELMKQYLITGIWLPPDAPLARAVANDPGWMLQYSSPAAVYYLRR